MHRRLTTVLIAAALMGLRATALPAQEAALPDLVGTWVLSVDDSDFGQSPAPDSALIVVERADEHIVMARSTFHPAIGVRTTSFDMPADGKPHEADTDDGTTEASFEWDEEVLVAWVLAQSNVGDVDVTERFALDTGTGHLAVEREIVVPGMGEFEQSFVFVRR